MGAVSHRSEWTESYGDVGGRRGGVMLPCPMLVVKAVWGVSRVIEKGTGRRQHPRQWRGAVSTTTSTLCEEIQRQPRRRPRLRWWVAEERLTGNSTFNKHDHVCLQAEFELTWQIHDSDSSTILCRDSWALLSLFLPTTM